MSDKGMAEIEKAGAAPQSLPTTARGVSLTHPEEVFLDYLAEYGPDMDAHAPLLEKYYGYGLVCRLRHEDMDYIREWVVSQGSHWLTCENAKLNRLMAARVFRNPIVRRIIDAAAARGLCATTSATKEELEDFLTQSIRSPFLGDEMRMQAAERLAKLKGYYPEKGSGGGGANVQINIVNPYAMPEPEVVCEAN